MEQKNTNEQNPKAKPVGPTKREKTITAIVAVVFVVGIVILGLTQKTL